MSIELEINNLKKQVKSRFDHIQLFIRDPVILVRAFIGDMPDDARQNTMKTAFRSNSAEMPGDSVHAHDCTITAVDDIRAANGRDRGRG